MGKDGVNVANHPEGIVNEELLHEIMRTYPDAAPLFLRRMCTNKPNTEIIIQKIINRLTLMPHYPRREPNEVIPLDTRNKALQLKSRVQPPMREDILANDHSENEILPASVMNGDLYKEISEMFENIEPTVLRNLCERKPNTPEVREEVINEILSLQPKCRHDQLEMLKTIFPHLDTTYLKEGLKNINSDHEFELMVTQLLQSTPNTSEGSELCEPSACIHSNENEAIALPNDVDRFQEVSCIHSNENEAIALPNDMGLFQEVSSIHSNEDEAIALPNDVDRFQEVSCIHSNQDEAVAHPNDVDLFQELSCIHSNEDEAIALPNDVDRSQEVSCIHSNEDEAIGLPTEVDRFQEVSSIHSNEGEAIALPNDVDSFQEVSCIHSNQDEAIALPNDVDLFQELPYFHSNKDEAIALHNFFQEVACIHYIKDEAIALPNYVDRFQEVACIHSNADEAIALPNDVDRSQEVSCIPSNEDEAIALPNDVDLFQEVSNIFPDADPEFLASLCANVPNIRDSVDSIVQKVFTMNEYPKCKMMLYDILQHVLPDADPQYLKDNLTKFKTHNEIDVFVSNALETHNYVISNPQLQEISAYNLLNAQDEATALPNNVIDDKNLFQKLSNIFPDADPDFLTSLTENVPNSEDALDTLVKQVFAMNDYPKQNMMPYDIVQNDFPIASLQLISAYNLLNAQDEATALPNNVIDDKNLFQKLSNIFPDADPDFLTSLTENVPNSEDALDTLVKQVFAMNDYPKQNMMPYDIVQNDFPIPNSLQEFAAYNVAEDEATALLTNIRDENYLIQELSHIFPDADPEFLANLCENVPNTEASLDAIVKQVFAMKDYPKHKMMPYDILHKVLPDADPQYLLDNIARFTTDNDLDIFISNALENRNYPIAKEPKIPLSQIKKHTEQFTVANFVRFITDPEEHFQKPECIQAYTQKVVENSYDLRLKFLENKYLSFAIDYIKQAFTDCGYNIIQTCDFLDGAKVVNVSVKRKPIPIVYDEVENISILEVLTYLTHKDEIDKYVEEKKILEVIERDRYRSEGLMLTCNCCCDSDVIPTDIVECAGGCTYCKFCLQKSVEIAFGDGKLEFLCLANCGKQFTLHTLRGAINLKLYSKIAQKVQQKEVKAAGIDELESCPFCEFATIPAPGDKLFKCLNPECMSESCRECKEVSHVPFRCNELEKDIEVKNRVYVENKMTEALVRQCRCGMKIIKSDGCNKMTCSCGATLCYVCKKTNVNYTHFNGQGGDKLNLCPLWCDVTLLHRGEVVASAEEAVAEVGLESLKINPALDIKTYYDKL